MRHRMRARRLHAARTARERRAIAAIIAQGGELFVPNAAVAASILQTSEPLSNHFAGVPVRVNHFLPPNMMVLMSPRAVLDELWRTPSGDGTPR